MSQAFTGSGRAADRAGEINEFVKRDRGTGLPWIWRCARASTRPWTAAWFGGLMQIINHITMLSIILTGAALIREREHGTIEHLLVMPVTPTRSCCPRSGRWAGGAGGRGPVAQPGRAAAYVPSRLAAAVLRRRGAVPVRHHVDGHLPGHAGAACRSSACC
jgi:hypothetical protein